MVTADDMPYIRLWQAVIAQAFIDLRTQNTTSPSVHFDRWEAQKFISNKRAFSYVCSLAGYDPEWVLDMMHKGGMDELLQKEYDPPPHKDKRRKKPYTHPKHRHRPQTFSKKSSS